MFASHFFSPLRRVTIAAGILLFTAASAGAATYVSVKGDNINVRTGPGTDNPVRMELFDGYPLQVIASEGEWLKISDYENDSGWIHNSLVEDGNTVIINGANSVNMRSEPSTKSAIIANVDRGVVLTKIESRGNWLKVKHSSGLDGWIYKPLLWP
jgi:SH3-like domain-containing protein